MGKARARRKPTVDTLSVDPFKRVPGHEKCKEYGTHAQDLFVHPNGALDIVAVDPGHVTLVDAVRYHASGGVPVPPVPSHDASRRGKRRYALEHKLAERNLTRFSQCRMHTGNRRVVESRRDSGTSTTSKVGGPNTYVFVVLCTPRANGRR